MKSKTKNLVFLLIIGLVFPLIINFNFNFSSNYKPIIENPKISGTYNGIFIDDTLTNNGTSWGNWTWARTQPWCTKGDGTKGTPYVIEDSTFLPEGPSDCLTIRNSRKHFIIENCTFKDIPVAYFSGLKLNNVTNGQIIDNRAYNNSYGIYLYDCHDNIISGNTVYNNIRTGIVLVGEPFIRGCYNITLLGNTVNNNTEQGICLVYNCDYNNITGNTANDNGASGILLDGQDGATCYKNIVSGNTAINNTQDGIHLRWECYNNTISGNTANDNTQNGIYCINYCANNTISGNTANDNDVSGIYLNQYCDYNTISGNTANGNDNDGIRLATECDDNTISGNTADKNIWYGIELWKDCDNNTLSGNNINDNKHRGIHLDNCDNITITDNTANYNTEYGIYLYQSHYTNITGNTANYNTQRGIYLENNCDNNTLSGNTANNNYDIGIYLTSNCDYNDIIDNILYNNTQGIRIASGCDNNSIYKNFFLENGIHAIDDGTDNNWNSSSIGNYWDNHTGPDADSDGIVDNAYTYIGGLADNIDNLPIAEDGAPTIDINSPTLGDIFGATAPSFNVLVTDDYLDEMWYTIDGGLHNYSFTENGLVNELAWGKVAEGNVTLTFYASDIPGNIGTKEVRIVKDYEAPTITINSPAISEYFGSTAPSFNVKITDDYLVSMWYTIDGGLHNYTFTTNSTINQTRWSAMLDGAIILRVYAIDDLGHIGSAEVNVIKDTVAPIIIINSPGEGETFGNTPPLFNITVQEYNLDEIWYSFDGGLTTYTITNNGTFNLGAWTALPQGEVTITFYARDLAGNEVSESVTVIKSVPSGLDPGVIITIVVVSIVGGIVIISVVYILMKKRG